MSPAAFAMLMAAAQKEFLAAFKIEDVEAIDSSLCRMKHLNRAYYGFDTFCDAPTNVRAA